MASQITVLKLVLRNFSNFFKAANPTNQNAIKRGLFIMDNNVISDPCTENYHTLLVKFLEIEVGALELITSQTSRRRFFDLINGVGDVF